MDVEKEKIFLTFLGVGIGVSLFLLKQFSFQKQISQTEEKITQNKEEKEEKNEINEKNAKKDSIEEKRVKVGINEEELMKEQCKRNIQFLGEENFAQFQSKVVAIVGLGGVGSNAAQMIVRSGISHIKLIDFAKINEISLSVNATADLTEIGQKKVEITRKKLLLSVPALKCEIFDIKLTNENMKNIFFYNLIENGEEIVKKVDYILDCTSDSKLKISLFHFCLEEKIPVISSFSLRGKTDPSKIRIADISETSNDLSLRYIRHKLYSKYRIRKGIKCVYSSEIDPSFSQSSGVLSPISSLFGNAMAMDVITSICNLEVNYEVTDSRSRRHYSSLITKLVNNEIKYHAAEEAVKKEEDRISVEDVQYIVQVLFQEKSAYSFSSPQNEKLFLARWDKSKKPTIENCVLLTQKEILRHYSMIGFEGWENDFVVRVNQILTQSDIASLFE